MLRLIFGIILILVGLLFALQTFGILVATLPFWSVVLTIFGVYLVVRSVLPSRFRLRSTPAWLKLSFGLWLSGIGVFNILHANGLTEVGGHDVWNAGWFILLIGAGLALIFGERVWFRGGVWSDGNGRGVANWLRWTDPDYYRRGVGVGDLHYGREPWVLDRRLRVRHHVGDVRIDLTSARIPDGTHHVDVAASVGEIVLIVPDNYNATVRARVGTGSINVFGERRDGVGAWLEKRVAAPEATVTLNIDVRLRIGVISVRRAPVGPREA